MVHKPVLVEEVLEYLKVEKNRNFVDATVGEGGQTIEILKRNGPEGKILAVDWNREVLKEAKRNIKEAGYGKRVIFEEGNFIEIDEIIKKHNFELTGGILADLGISSWLLERGRRGFSFQKDELLDMRFNSDSRLKAMDVVNLFSQSELEKIIRELGEEKEARNIAEKIVEKRKAAPVIRTGELREIAQSVYKGKRSRINPATKVFQALRIYVNGELDNLGVFLRKSFDILPKGGRLVIISFHSLEDRIVKNFFREKKMLKRGIVLTKKPVRPSFKEVSQNLRARSAKLRAIEKI